jgi:hypothetical protein
VSTEENKAIVRRLFEGFLEKRDDDVLGEVFAPNYVHRLAFTG